MCKKRSIPYPYGIKAVAAALTLLLLAAGVQVHAQRNIPVFEAFSDAEEVFPDTYFQLTFSLQNAEGKDFKAPDLKDFRVLAGPSRGISTSVINGQVSMQMTFSYTLQPRKAGKFTIGSASITVGNRTMSTRPLTITVLEGKPGQAGRADDSPEYFVRAELSAQQAYIGQQVRLDYKLYTTVEIQNYNMVEESPYLDFYAEDLMRADPRTTRERINGREYAGRILKSIALYPQKAGELTIQPASIQLGVVTGGGGLESFFFGADVKRMGVVTEAVTVKVNPAPPGAPPSFSGAVGAFESYASINRMAITTDDVLTLEWSITGDGDLKRIQAPKLYGVDSFDVYEPSVKEEIYGEELGRRVGRKVFEYLIAPKVRGQYSIRPVFTYFSPAEGIYKTLSEQTFEVDVRQGQQKTGEGTVESSAGALDGIALLQPKQLSRKQARWVHQPAFLGFLILPFLLFGAVLGWQAHQHRHGAARQESRLQLRAREIAVQRLKEAYAHVQNGQSRSFYEAVSAALWRHTAERLKLPLSQQSKEEILLRLEQNGLPESDLGTFRQILQNCELALFAGMANADAMQQTYDQARQMLEKLERFFQKRG